MVVHQVHPTIDYGDTGIPLTPPQPPQSQGSTGEITVRNITWYFSGTNEFGQFVNGDYWVLGPVTITGIVPTTYDAGGGWHRHGSMVDPVCNPFYTGYGSDPQATKLQGYDSSMDNNSYNVGFNAAWGVSDVSPLILSGMNSLISSESIGSQGDKSQQLQSAEVLTIAKVIPETGSFRPPYSYMTDKDSYVFKVTGDIVNTGMLQTLTPEGSAPTIQTVSDLFEAPWISHAWGWAANRMHPINNMKGYQQYVCGDVEQGAVMLHHDYTIAQKEELLYRFLQVGIDLKGVAESPGGHNAWIPGGGTASFRKYPIFFAGIMFDDSEFVDVATDGSIAYGEDAQTWRVTEYDVTGRSYAAGYGGYTLAMTGMPEWGNKHTTNSPYDAAKWSITYRQCCTALVWIGQVLGVQFLNEMTGNGIGYGTGNIYNLWNHDVFFDYEDRYMTKETSIFRGYIPWVEDTWDTYRVPTDPGPWPTVPS